MTRLPLEDRNVRGAPGHFVPVMVCAHPTCDGVWDIEVHHVWPRSFLRHQPQDYVTLPNGKVVPNKVGFCRDHHRMVTENEARVEWGEVGYMWIQELVNGGEWSSPLDPQPSIEKAILPVPKIACPTCKGTGFKEEKKKDDLPPLESRPKRTWAVAVPIEARDPEKAKMGEDGHALIESLLASAAELLDRDGHKSWKYFVLIEVLYWFVSSFEKLKEVEGE